jgi:hypothetical protein
MSTNLFTNGTEAIARLESLLQSVCKTHILTFNSDKNSKGTFYTAQISFTRRDETLGYLSVDGDSYPDLFNKISDHLTKPN